MDLQGRSEKWKENGQKYMLWEKRQEMVEVKKL